LLMSRNQARCEGLEAHFRLVGSAKFKQGVPV
jgi:hypothetical protein